NMGWLLKLGHTGVAPAPASQGLRARSRVRRSGRRAQAHNDQMKSKTGVDPAGSEAAAASVTYHLPAEPLRTAVTTYYLVKVTGAGVVRDQIFPEWANFRLILSGDW